MSGAYRRDYGASGCCGPETALFAICLAAAPWCPAALLAPPVAVLSRRAAHAIKRGRP